MNFVTLVAAAVCLLQSSDAQPFDVLGVNILTSQELKEGIDNGKFNAVLDVRTQEEWDAGHIPTATFAESLNTFESANHQGAKPTDFMGCENCVIAVYCSSGNRASTAARILTTVGGFKGQVFNGLGTSDWTSAGFELVNDDSVEPPCLTDTTVQEECKNMVLAASGGGITSDEDMKDPEDMTDPESMTGDETGDDSASAPRRAVNMAALLGAFAWVL